MKTKLMLSLATLTLAAAFAPARGQAAVIPKLTLATCDANKEDFRHWFQISRGDSAAFDSVQNPLKLSLQTVALAGRPAIANYFVVTLRGTDAAGRAVALVQRDLEQVAVNFAGGAYSIGYAPYDVSRTSAEPFSLLIEPKSEGGKAASGLLSWVALQSSSRTPLRPVELECEISGPPAEPVRVTAAEIAAFDEPTRFNVIHDLFRLNLTGTRLSLSSRRGGDAEDPTTIGLSTALLGQVRAQIAARLNTKDLPPVAPGYLDADEKREAIATPGDRCGQLSISSVTPVYDSVNARALRANPTSSARAQAIGYVLHGTRCLTAARTIVMTKPGEEPRRREDFWRVDTIVISGAGLIGEYSFAASDTKVW